MGKRERERGMVNMEGTPSPVNLGWKREGQPHVVKD